MTMDVAAAWQVLGRDVNQVLHGTSDLPTVEAKMEAVEQAAALANRLAKKLLAQNHPDRNPEPTAAGRYQEVLDALEAIRSHTEGFRSRVDAIKDRIANPPEGSIQIG